jgi:hypothetical protein
MQTFGFSASIDGTADRHIRLEDTPLAVTADQAKTLLPLWEMLQSLSSSSTAATEEIDAVVNQIKSTMTSEQMDEITS